MPLNERDVVIIVYITISMKYDISTIAPITEGDFNMSDITIHIDENTSHDEREGLRDSLLAMDGVTAAAYHDEKPHLMVIAYEPDTVDSAAFLQAISNRGLHGELIG